MQAHLEDEESVRFPPIDSSDSEEDGAAADQVPADHHVDVFHDPVDPLDGRSNDIEEEDESMSSKSSHEVGENDDEDESTGEDEESNGDRDVENDDELEPEWEPLDDELFEKYKEQLVRESDNDPSSVSWDVTRTIGQTENDYIKAYADASGLRVLRPKAIKKRTKMERNWALLNCF